MSHQSQFVVDARWEEEERERKWMHFIPVTLYVRWVRERRRKKRKEKVKIIRVDWNICCYVFPLWLALMNLSRWEWNDVYLLLWGYIQGGKSEKKVAMREKKKVSPPTGMMFTRSALLSEKTCDSWLVFRWECKYVHSERWSMRTQAEARQMQLEKEKERKNRSG